MKKCIVDNCDTDAFYKESQLCQACYAGFYYWSDKTPTRIIRRRRQLAKLESRMSMLQPNVKQLKRKKHG